MYLLYSFTTTGTYEKKQIRIDKVDVKQCAARKHVQGSKYMRRFQSSLLFEI